MTSGNLDPTSGAWIAAAAHGQDAVLRTKAAPLKGGTPLRSVRSDWTSKRLTILQRALDERTATGFGDQRAGGR